MLHPLLPLVFFAGSSADRSVPSPVIAGELGWV